MPIIRKSLPQAKPLSAQQRAKLAGLKDRDIDFSDNPEMTATDLKRGLLKPVGRGGFRPGAGRKPSGRQPVSLRREGKTISEVAEDRLLGV
jgi:hypothetical protein